MTDYYSITLDDVRDQVEINEKMCREKCTSDPSWILVDQETGEEVHVGDDREDFRGEKVRITYLFPPHKISSSGKVKVAALYQPWTSVFYPSVIGCEFKKKEK